MIKLRELVGDETGYDGDATVSEDDACDILVDLQVHGQVFVEPTGLVEPTVARIDPRVVTEL